MLGLVQLAARLAEWRCVLNITDADGMVWLATREEAAQDDAYPTSAEYYRICDRIARGEKP